MLLADRGADGEDRSGLEALEEVLTSLQSADARRYRQVTARLSAIDLANLGTSNGEYHEGSRTCMLDRATLFERLPVATAGTIVHEAMHARLCDLGIGYGEPIRDRVEHLCSLEQLRFLRRASAPQELLDRAEAALEVRALTDEEVLQHDLDAMGANGIPRSVAALLLAPRWLIWRLRH